MNLIPGKKSLGLTAILSLAMYATSFAQAQQPPSIAPTWQFPDGFSGLTPIILQVSAGTPYTVPAGKNLYITQVGRFSQTCSPVTSCALIAGGGANLLFNGQFTGPLIVGTGAVVTSSAALHTFDIFGFTVPATVTAVIQDLAPSASYTVPPGQNFYWLNMGAINSSAFNFSVNGAALHYYSGTSPLVIGAGQTITNNGAGTFTLDGYLATQ